ncbi:MULTISPECIES: phospholipid scramblase-related protein [Streptomyces]|uniref:phospholipid scramblase-related protein n=1 Tax=Streptomyces TaxID=1883 RepID=UPI002DD81C00|nr:MULTISPECIES: phospholipid scramblase-related protein [unclassified Streptomyces]WSD95045.1 phospholipid scramblase-related protein [Streptomyces sp. NBC_01474]
MTTQSNTPAGWYPDPQGAPQTLRWWDGAQWTEHTSPVQQPAGQQVPRQAQQPQQQPAQQAAQGQFAQQQQPVQQHQPQQPGQYQQPQQHAAGPYGQQVPQQQQQQQYVDPAKVQRQVQHQAGVAPTAQGGGSLFTEPVLVVNQKAKLIELTNEYTVMDQNGAQIGSVVQVGQSTLKKVARFVSSLDQFMTHKLEIRDAYGQPQLVMTRPAKFMKSRVVVERPDGSPVGEIVQQNMIGKINFGINVNGQQIGAIKAENWRAWNFSIVDHADNEVARITKTWEGLAKTMFTTADNYVLQIHYQLPEPLLSLVVATALTVDTALKQDARGFG